MSKPVKVILWIVAILIVGYLIYKAYKKANPVSLTPVQTITAADAIVQPTTGMGTQVII